jgi:vancomycin permeability regulator SanA
MQRLSRFKKFLYPTLLFWFTLHTAYIIFDGITDKGKTADIALILGNKVNEDGTLSRGLAHRMQCGLELYKAGRFKKIIVSGGKGKEGHFEGDKMREFLLQNGVPDSIIIVDNEGFNTRASMKNTLLLRKKLHFNSVLVISQYFHLTRSKMLFRKSDLQVSSASPRFFELRDVYSLVREFAAFYQQLF